MSNISLIWFLKTIYMKKLYVLIFCVFTTSLIKAQTPLSYYLPQDISYNATIPKPQDVFGFNIGDQHVSHDQVVMYMKELARLSDRITLVEYAKSYENRKLLLLTITSPDNQKNIDLNFKLSSHTTFFSKNLKG